MPSYRYASVNDLGRKVRGVLIADNVVDLENRLKELGLELLDYKEVKERKAGFFGRIKIQDMIILCLHLEQLDRAGVPLHDALADVRDSTESPKLRDILTGVYESVKGGEVLSKALAKHPRVFDDVFVGLVAAGEKTGNLAESFMHLSEHLKWSGDIRRKVKKAMTYPTAVFFLMVIVISILMLLVVPKMVAFLQEQGFDLPIHTRALIWTSEFFGSYWYVVLGVPLFTGIGLSIAYRLSEAFAYKFDSFLLWLPVIGPTVRKINLARFTHFFGVMFKSGIDILEALSAAKNVVGNRVIQESILIAKKSITEGSSLTNALRISNQFPNLVVRMFKVGEDSGNMNDALENINFFYNREVNDAVDALVGLVQPILTVVMGGLIFWVVAAVFGPLYQSFSKMKF